LRLLKPSILLLIVACSAIAPVAFGQEQAENDSEKAAAVIRDVINKRGGEAYLSIRTIVSRGTFTPYEKGVSAFPSSFVDYISYPAKERTEFGKGDHKFIQTNSEGANWVYDGKQKMIRDQTDEQIKQFQQGSRYDLDNLLRAASRQEGVKLVYLGRREPWRGTFSEAVRIDFTDGGSAILHIDPRAKMPLMTEYKAVGEEGTANNESRYYRWLPVGRLQWDSVSYFDRFLSRRETDGARQLRYH
jgi:hypothetical protein